jgi:hypothetical protein
MYNTPRKVKFSTIWRVLKKKPVSMIFGIMFTLMPIVIVIILSIVFSSIGNDTPKVDYDLINENGKEVTAEITDIETQYNVTINGVHPTIISYRYEENGKQRGSKYKVLEQRKIAQMEIGDDLEIKVFEGSSIIKGLKPYDFPFGLFMLIPLPFLLMGSPFLIYAIVHLKRELKLYKLGKVAQGKIVSLIPKPGLPLSNIGRGVYVHYLYQTSNGNKITGESISTDQSLLFDKNIGDIIPIFISQEDESKSCMVPKLAAFRNGWDIPFE